MLLSEAREVYLARLRQENYSEYTMKAYRLQLVIMERDVGDLPIGDYTEAMLRAHVEPFVARLKPASLCHKIRALRVFFKWLYEDEQIPTNPMRKINEPKVGKRIPKAMNMDDVETIRDACRTDFERALIEVFFATGCRLSEVMRMDRDNIDFDRRTIQVIGKGNKEREVYFGSKAAMRLRKYLASRTDDSPALFVTLQGEPKRRAAPHTLYHHVKRIAARSGVARNVSPHTWRHTLATMLLNQGAPLETVQGILGHDKPSTTQLYAVLSGERRHEDFKKYFAQ